MGLHARDWRAALGRPASGIESKYLLTGLTTCSFCGGSLVVQSRISGDDRKFLYHCSYSNQAGPLLAGTVPAGLSKSMVPPMGLVHFAREFRGVLAA